jgi:zinc D-Ala-D-Ala carboxypeptidase
MAEMISPHFSLDELIRTGTGLENDPHGSVRSNLERLCREFLEPIRSQVGALRVNSGFRSPEVNRAVGGVRTSAHLDGRAADIVPLECSCSELFEAVKRSGLDFDQCILEPGWVHVGIAREGQAPRRELLLAQRGQGGMVYREVPNA